MVERVKKLLSMEVGEIISSPQSIELLKVYSLLYINGGQPRTCSRSQKRYYDELTLTGLEMATKYNKLMERTCKTKLGENELRYIWGDFYTDAQITDAVAIKLLDNGGLTESDFEKLPDGYKMAKPEPIKTTTEPVKETPKPQQHKGNRKRR